MNRKAFLYLIPFALVIGSCRTAETPIDQSEMKFHPGHYVAVEPDFDVSSIKYLEDPAVIGVNKRYRWKDLEPVKGEYDFSSIEADLTYLAAHNKQLVVFLIDRSFVRKGALPPYLAEYELQAEGGGFVPLRWYPQVTERLIKLGESLGQRFDAHPAFEGVALQESALDFRKEDYKRTKYTPTKYRDALIAIIIAYQKAMPHSRVFWYGNFIPKDGNGTIVETILKRVEPYGICYGGPDILPYHSGYNETSYPLFERYQGRFPLFSSAQDDSYRHHKNDRSHEITEPLPEEGYLTMEEIFLFARDSLHLQYLFWNYYFGEAIEGERTYEDAIQVIRKYPTFNTPGGQFGERE